MHNINRVQTINVPVQQPITDHHWLQIEQLRKIKKLEQEHINRLIKVP